MNTPKKPERVGAPETRRALASTAPPLLVSAYPRRMFDRFHLDGALPLEDLDARLATLGKEQEIIFY